MQKKLLNIFYSINEFQSQSSTFITIGTFDGVHIGHQKILLELVRQSLDLGLEPTVLTFFPHPRKVVNINDDVKFLTTSDEKIEILKELGIKNLIIHPFDADFANLNAENFVSDLLVGQLKMKKIIIGYDHRFGKGRSADVNDLINFGKLFDFEVIQISKQTINDFAVSSTKIRNALINGDIVLANQLLGYNFKISGVVEKGQQLGRTIGFPTANVFVKEEYKLIPALGVYVVEINVGNMQFEGVLNIGKRPTVNGSNITIEVHIFDFNQDIYDKTIQLELLEKIRDEKKFDSLDSLKNQIAEDALIAKKYFNSK